VTFVDCASVQAVFASPKLVLDGKEIEVKSAFKKIEEQLGVQSILPMQESCKIFVGGISQVLLNYFLDMRSLTVKFSFNGRKQQKMKSKNTFQSLEL